METQGLKINRQLRNTITANLVSFERHPAARPNLRAAAVAIVITSREANDTACFLLTRRTTRLKRHGGQYALPGGRVDPGEDAQGAALRELSEELGLAIAREQVLGLLDDFPTRSGYCITPVVVWGGMDPQITANTDEVAAVFRIPLDELNDPQVPTLQSIPESDQPVLSVPFPTLGHEIYAPTAAVLYQFREVALCGRTTRAAHYEQPVFAWR